MKVPNPLALFLLAGSLPSQAALTDNLVAYWGFEGASSNDAAATGGSAYNGVLSGNATTTTTITKVGSGALRLDGAGDYMTVAAIPNLNSSWGISAWFNPTVVPAGTGDANRYFVYESYQSASAGYGMSFGLRDGTAGNTNFQVFTDLVTADQSRDTQIPDGIVANTWHHIVETYDATTKTLLIYINGIPQAPISLGTDTFVSATSLRVGCARATTRFFNGSIDEVSIWDRSLSATEVASVYQLGTNGLPVTTLQYQVDLSASPLSGGSVTGTGIYIAGASAPVTATPNPGYVFTAWSGDFTGQPASFTYTANANATATATFAEDTADPDNDGLTNYQEIITYGTLPNNPDTDGDLIPDGAEIQIGTVPTTSDAALISFVQNNLSTGNAGAIALSTPRLNRDAGTGAITLSLGISGSADQAVWQAIDLGDPSVSIIPSGNGWSVTIPAPSDTVNSYILLGSQP